MHFDAVDAIACRQSRGGVLVELARTDDMNFDVACGELEREIREHLAGRREVRIKETIDENDLARHADSPRKRIIVSAEDELCVASATRASVRALLGLRGAIQHGADQ